MLEPGTIVGGKLRIDRILGEGGMGVVAVATHLELDQKVAVKVLHDDILKQADVVERFIREARASARLRSEHVCKVHDVGRLDSGAPYLVMELLEGDDLGTIIENARLREPVAADFVLQACVGIGEAHAHGIVHRDLKPRNLFVTRRLDDTPLVKVLDFGIAKAPAPADAQLTKTTTVIGSPGYMSPEQLRSAKDVDARSDIWSLGVILYECVAGQLPFASDTLMELAVKISMDPPTPLVGVEPRYAAITMRCLEKDPAKRYQTVAELATDLATLAELETGATAMMNRDLVAKLLFGKTGGGSASRPMMITKATAQTELGPSGPQVQPSKTSKTTLGASAGVADPVSEEPKKKSRTGLIAAVVALLVVGGGLGAAFALGVFGGGRKEPAKHPHKDAGVVVAQVDAAQPVDASVLVQVDAPVAIDAAPIDAPPIDAAVPVHVDAAVPVHVDAAVPVHVDAAVPTPDAAVTPPVEDPKQLLAEARAAQAEGKHRVALQKAEAALKANPHEQGAHNIAALAACELGDKAAAERHIGSVGKRAQKAIRRACRAHGVNLGGQEPERDDDRDDRGDDDDDRPKPRPKR